MAKLQVYKFVNPGSSSTKDSTVAAARTQTLALNRLGKTVSDLGKVVSDIEKISIAQIKDDRARAQAERRRERRIRDAASETAQESGGSSQKPQKLDRGIANKIKEKGKKGLRGSLGFIDTFLGPIGEFLLRIGTFVAVKELMTWMSDEENQKKLGVFIDKAKFVFEKIFGWASSLVQTTLDGFGNLFGEDSDFGDRLKGIGQILLGITGLRYLMNPFALIGDIYDLFGGGDDLPDRRPDPDEPDKPRKPKKPTATNPSGADPDLPGPRGRRTVGDIAEEFGSAASKKYDDILKKYGDDAARAFALELSNTGGDASRALARWKRLGLQPIDPPKPGLLRRFWEGTIDLGGKGLNMLQGLGQGALDLIKKGIKQIPALPNPLEVSQKVLSKLSSAGRAVWSNTVAAGQAIGNTASKWGSNVKNFAAKSVDNLSKGAKNFFMNQIMSRLQPLIDPLMGFASKAGKSVMEFLMKIPGFDQVGKFLKSKGIDSVATAGSKLGKRASAVLPVIGGIVNLLFAYDRFANGDTIGGILESISGILDIGGLATAGASSVASMFLDGYLFARDFIPQLSEAEDSLISALGLGPFKLQMDEFFGQLPNLGELFGGFMDMIGMGGDEDKDDNGAGTEPDMIPQSALDMVDQYSVGGGVKPQEMFLGGVVKGISKAVSGIGKTVSGIVNNPIVQTVAPFIPGVGPIVAGVGAVSGLMSGNPMGAIMSGLNMIPGMSGIMGQVSNFMSGPFGQIGSQLLGGNILGAATTGLSMLDPAIGQMAGSILSGGLNPMSMVGGLAEQFGMSGLFKAVTGVMGGDIQGGIKELGGQLGIDPKILGGVESVTQKALASDKGLSAEYAMQAAMEFVPVPVILEKLVPMPTPVPINTGAAAPIVAGGPSSLTQRQ